MVEITLGLQVKSGTQTRTFADAAKGLRIISQNTIDFSKLDPTIRRNILKFLRKVAGQMSERHGKRWPGGTGPLTLSKRSGQLVSTIRSSVKVSGNFSRGDGVVGQIGSPLIYASTHEFSATITPKSKRWLTVPLPAALNANGTMKLPKARDYPNTFIRKSRKGNLLIFQKRGRRRIVPLFVLKDKVKIPARLNLGATLRQGLPELGDAITLDILREFKIGKL